MTSYRTLAAPATAALEIKRSRFLALLTPSVDETDARLAIAQARAVHPKARHHCTAFVIGPRQELQRSNDDGEPSGTAGTPMLETLVAAGLSDVTAVVVRYFGGILLGAGGLTRAYRAAVAAAIEDARVITRAQRLQYMVSVDYAAASSLEAEARKQGWIFGAHYAAEVDVTLAVPEDERDLLQLRLSELTGGRSEARPIGTGWVTL
ncbi:YigZ family protein [Nakamurella sp. YIM 132087]|uniref:YigZ family protein n=1 Tax=Nakamurella alba TaxID=2665158 RepID=A0A7K1FGX7_9ACTN|nr:YigZ family protein [Nakamurella alba]MTD13326.1 YigZ family protein [Nakamurella alba]